MIERILARIARAGSVDLSEIDPTPDEYSTDTDNATLEGDVISTADCVKECQKVSAEWREHMRRLGIEV